MTHPSTLNKQKFIKRKKLNSKTRLTSPWTRNRRETAKQCEANDMQSSESRSMQCYPRLQLQGRVSNKRAQKQARWRAKGPEDRNPEQGYRFIRDF